MASNVVEQKQQEEDASILKFPKEFENAETLLISEVHSLMEERRQEYEKSEESLELPKVFLKTHEYCERFSRFKNRETIASIRKYNNKNKYLFWSVIVANHN
jgi:DNA-directed RNA polymerase II subunit RPB4